MFRPGWRRRWVRSHPPHLQSKIIWLFFAGVLEPALVRLPSKKYLELQLCKSNALKVVRANPGLGQGNGLPCPPWRELLGSKLATRYLAHRMIYC